MALSSEHADVLAVLRSGKPLAGALGDRYLTAEEFQAALARYLRSKVPILDGKIRAKIRRQVRIFRDAFGVPHISTDDPHDMFFAYGYAMAQDRLWQLDYLRRAAHGRLAEIMGEDALASDIEVRTIGIGQIARDLVSRLPEETLETLVSFVEGINEAIEDCADNLPVEFDILRYRCEPWTVADTLALMKHFWWQLTGRLYQISGPELMRRALGEGSQFDAYLQSEVHGESILPPGENRARPLPPVPGAGTTLSGEMAGPGSNNWALGPGKSATGQALFASDPHTPYGAPTIWYEVHLHGAGYEVAGMSYVGTPGIVFGRNRKGAWGITNNICSLRDLFVYPSGEAGQQAKKEQQTHRISVRGAPEHVFRVANTDLGPVVNHLLAPPIQHGPPVVLRWVGTEVSDEIGALLRLNQAGSPSEFRKALTGWTCPTFNFLWADGSGDIAYQCAGRLVRRRVVNRGLRAVDDPEQHWAGFFPYESNPWCVNPQQGWIGTANNPVLRAMEDPGLGGMWTSDARARRIRKKMESQDKFTLEECADLQLDNVSERVRDVLPALITALETTTDNRVRAALRLIRDWNGDMAIDSPAAAIFDAFARQWANVILAEWPIPDTVRELVTKHIFGLMFELIKKDYAGWFVNRDRTEGIQIAMRQALNDLTTRLGADMERWRWGDIHTLTLRHPLGKREPLTAIFDTGPRPIGGSGHTVNNQWANSSGPYESTAGAVCRIAADLGTADLHITNCLGQSGHPGSPHYRDQHDDWHAGRLHVLSLRWEQIEAEAKHRLELWRGSYQGV
jgi:penicillin amidase